MTLCNQTSDPNECVIFFFKDRVGKPIFMHLLLKIKVFPENMGIGLDKKKTWDLPKIGKFINFRPLLHSQ